MAFVVTWSDGRPQAFADHARFDTTGGTLRIGFEGDGDEWPFHFSPIKWQSVRLGEPTPEEVEEERRAREAYQGREQPSFGRLAAGPGLNFRGARQ